MDWGPLSRMSDEDLKALYMFLQSIPPVDNDVSETMFKKTKEEG